MCNKTFAILRNIFHFDPFRALYFILVGITYRKNIDCMRFLKMKKKYYLETLIQLFADNAVWL